MGIDVYLRWKGQTEEEEQAQYTGYSTVHGHVGYLREAYHGKPYATEVLVPEGFIAVEAENGGIPIPAATLRARLPAALAACDQRYTTLYDDASPELIARVKQSFTDFVALAETKEAQTGEPVRIIVSG